MAGSRELRSGDPVFKGYDAHSVKSGNIYKYIIGKHASKADAQEQLKFVKKTFPDAFLVKVAGNVISRP